MSDVFSTEKRSDVMKKVRPSGNKTTELRLIKYFSSNHITGWRRKYKVKGHPDFVFLDRKIAIFVDGCFWHAHDGCKWFVPPKTNTDFWNKKFEYNIERDRNNYQLLRKMGWNVIVIWECQLKPPNRITTLNWLYLELHYVPIQMQHVSS